MHQNEEILALGSFLNDLETSGEGLGCNDGKNDRSLFIVEKSEEWNLLQEPHFGINGDGVHCGI